MNEKRVLNAGYVKLLESMGGDQAVIKNARICWGSEDRASEKGDRNLIRHLLREGHMSPFEAMVFRFEVKCPIFIARQWMRHRMGSFNEKSMRYCIAEKDFYNPYACPHGTIRDDEAKKHDIWRMTNETLFDFYNELIQEGMPKEQARSILPQGMYTTFLWNVNGSSLMNFLLLRLNKGAQEEIRVYAKEILVQVKQIAPVAFTEWQKLYGVEDG